VRIQLVIILGMLKESEPLDRDVQVSNISQSKVNNSFDVIFSQESVNGLETNGTVRYKGDSADYIGMKLTHLFANQYSVLISYKTILRKTIVGFIDDVLTKLLFLLNQIRPTHNSDFYLLAQSGQKLFDLRCHVLSRDSESVVHIKKNKNLFCAHLTHSTDGSTRRMKIPAHFHASMK